MLRRRLIAGSAALLLPRAGHSAPPPAGGASLTRIAFASCADQGQPQPIWTAVHDYAPELFIFAGDNVYGDVSSGDLRELRAAYAAATEIPGYARLRRETPLLATWDDHDYGANDAGAEFPWKQASKELFLSFWGVPADDPRRAREGLYHAATFGPPERRVQVVLLDTRWFRSPLKPTDRRGAAGRERYVADDDPAKTVLGAAQWDWLAARLREPAALRLIVSSIQVLAEGHGWERWGNFPRERQRLFDLIAATAANGVVFLSGDRHLGAFYRETAGTPYPLPEATSSGINKAFRSREPGPNRLGEVVGEANFGTIDIDWNAGRAAMALRGIDGGIRASLALDLAALRAR
ncbi:MAG: alkaline phosphatase family protein [Alphaproteobacteria bacterium]|nr:alkaline phosphatase family protein [Alphaproteobacteria bacterium]